MCEYENECANASNVCTSVRALPKEVINCFKPACLTCGEPSEWDECIYCLVDREKANTRKKIKAPKTIK